MSSTHSENDGSHSYYSKGLAASGLAALGIVFGDIGTSPLYAFKIVMSTVGGAPDRMAVLGSLSLLIWTLVIVTTIKYVLLAMRVDNDGEGGILALMSLLGVRDRKRPLVAALGLMGAALIYGDGAITPAISVLSALEGLELALPEFKAHVVPCAAAILLALFSFQSRGTAHIGRLFGPVMLTWFSVLALLGIAGVLRHPEVLEAINPYYGLSFLAHSGPHAFLVLGGVFLCVTGAEALYADMGHFGPRPIRLGWFFIVFPSLVLNYAGQAALVLGGTQSLDNLFFQLSPPLFTIPLVLLATLATIIASQAMITGAFSMTRQAIQLGWLPRMEINQTSAEGYGQIYIGAINWMLMLVTLGLTLSLRRSQELAAAYGVAVSITMLATTLLLSVAMREVWRWGRVRAWSVAGAFLVVDSLFFFSNSVKFFEGGYIPLLMAAVIYGAMVIWKRGVEVVSAQMQEAVEPVAAFMARIERENVARVRGAAVFLTRTVNGIPPAMVWHVRHSRALHERLFVLRVVTDSVPWIRNRERLTVEELAPGFWRAVAHYGFMERPNIPALLKQSRKAGCDLSLDDITYYVGRETVLACDNKRGMPYWMEKIFVVMQRNSAYVTEYFNLPVNSVVEVGRLVEI